MLSLPIHAQAIHVDDDATGAGTGIDWANAYTDLQSALNDPAFPGSQIWVAEGTYVPTVRTDVTIPRSETFVIPAGGEIYGVFKPGDTSVGTRTGSVTLTHLSGDLPSSARHAFHVVTLRGNGTINTNRAILNGFTIIDGEATAGPGVLDGTLGAGIICIDSFLRIESSILTENHADDDGGAMFSRGSRLEIKECTYDDNSVWDTGAGISIFATEVHVLLWNCLFKNNRTTTTTGIGWGAGVFVADGQSGKTIKIYNSVFHDNLADSGGGLYCFSGDVEVGNCTFSYNQARVGGAGIFACASTVVSNTIVFDNSMMGFFGPTPSLRPGIDYISGSSPTVLYSDCQEDIVLGVLVNPPWTGSNGNITAQPSYTNGAARKLALISTSAGVDVGDNASVFSDLMDLDRDTTTSMEETPFHKTIGEPRRSSSLPGDIVDMGAYEYQW